jgi:hypothetical protein
VYLLNNGVDIQTVQFLLGHTSIKTTEKYYAPFVRATQDRLDAAVSTLHFTPAPDRKLAVNAGKHARGNAGRVLAFARAKGR